MKLLLLLSELAGLVVARRPLHDDVQPVERVDDGDLGDDRREFVVVVVLGSVRPGFIRDTAAVSDAGALLGELEPGSSSAPGLPQVGKSRRRPCSPRQGT